MSNKKVFEWGYLLITIFFIGGSYWFDWMFFIWFGLTIIGTVILIIINNIKQSKRLEYLEDRVYKIKKDLKTAKWRIK